METNDFLAQLGDQMGVPGLCLDEDNVCRLVFDDSIPVEKKDLAAGKLIQKFLGQTVGNMKKT